MAKDEAESSCVFLKLYCKTLFGVHNRFLWMWYNLVYDMVSLHFYGYLKHRVFLEYGPMFLKFKLYCNHTHTHKSCIGSTSFKVESQNQSSSPGIDAAGNAFHHGVQQAILGLSVGLFYALLLNWVHQHDIPGTGPTTSVQLSHWKSRIQLGRIKWTNWLFETQFSQWYINHWN